MLFTGIESDLIERIVVRGYRLPLDAITGAADLVSFAMRWIPLCWHQSPDERPSFDGKHCCCDTHDCHCVFVFLELWFYGVLPSSL